MDLTIINDILFHKTTISGLIYLIQNYNKNDLLCCSTKSSLQLISKYGEDNVVIIFKKKKRKGYYSEKDIDAKKYFGYDEFRTKFKMAKNEIYDFENENYFNGININQIKKIIISDETFKYLRELQIKLNKKLKSNSYAKIKDENESIEFFINSNLFWELTQEKKLIKKSSQSGYSEKFLNL